MEKWVAECSKACMLSWTTGNHDVWALPRVKGVRLHILAWHAKAR